MTSECCQYINMIHDESNFSWLMEFNVTTDIFQETGTWTAQPNPPPHPALHRVVRARFQFPFSFPLSSACHAGYPQPWLDKVSLICRGFIRSWLPEVYICLQFSQICLSMIITTGYCGLISTQTLRVTATYFD